MSARISSEQKQKVLEALEKSGNNTVAAKYAGVERHAITRECKRDKKFEQGVAEAKQAYADYLESLGDKEAQSENSKGSFIWWMFRLKALRPDVYRENQTVKHEGNIQIISGIPRPVYTDNQPSLDNNDIRQLSSEASVEDTSDPATVPS